jgi:hypothetical protein
MFCGATCPLLTEDAWVATAAAKQQHADRRADDLGAVRRRRALSLVIVLACVRLARCGAVLGEKSGLGRSWIGVVLLAATLPDVHQCPE